VAGLVAFSDPRPAVRWLRPPESGLGSQDNKGLDILIFFLQFEAANADSVKKYKKVVLMLTIKPALESLG
jgi:hypothetical protein